MKTLKNALIIAVAAICFGFVNLFAEMKAEKVKSAHVTGVLDPKTEKIRMVSDQAIRDVLLGVLNNAFIERTGRVNIVFKVNADKQVEILNVFGYNPELVSHVKKAVLKTAIIIPEALEGKYMITAVF
ncbi:MAG TPA: hypothetical protein VIH57_13885 [Bacteroidales bacterium]